MYAESSGVIESSGFTITPSARTTRRRLVRSNWPRASPTPTIEAESVDSKRFDVSELRKTSVHGHSPSALASRPLKRKDAQCCLSKRSPTHPDRQEIEVACSLEEVPRQRHAVVVRDTCLSGRLRHGVHEPPARGQIAFRHGRAGRPVLFVRTNARSPEITHPTGPQVPVGGHVAGNGIFCSVGTAVIDPAIVGEKR